MRRVDVHGGRESVHGHDDELGDDGGGYAVHAELHARTTAGGATAAKRKRKRKSKRKRKRKRIKL